MATIKKTPKPPTTGIRNDKLFCFNCGKSFDMQLPQPITFSVQLMKLWDKTHKNCSKTWQEPVCNPEWPKQTREHFWLQNGEHGESVKCMYNRLVYPVFTNNSNTAHPHDPDDFRRCYLLLQCVPELREKLDLMRRLSSVWGKLVDNWDKLTEMLEIAINTNQPATEMNELMKQLGC